MKRITYKNYIHLIWRVWQSLPFMPLKTALKSLIRPVDAARYLEYSWMLEVLKQCGLKKDSDVLDVSSPFMMAYFLSRRHRVLKTDINAREGEQIKPTRKLRFEWSDATQMQYEDNHFDLVYSLSVIEHIYGGYLKAVQEMIRVTKPGGYVLITAPVSREHVEEWLNTEIYSDQKKISDKVFFQYRFSESDILALEATLHEHEIVTRQIFWEQHDGAYDRLVNRLSKHNSSTLTGFLNNAWVNFWAGIALMRTSPEAFDKASSFGNWHVLIRKR